MMRIYFHQCQVVLLDELIDGPNDTHPIIPIIIIKYKRTGGFQHMVPLSNIRFGGLVGMIAVDKDAIHTARRETLYNITREAPVESKATTMMAKVKHHSVRPQRRIAILGENYTHEISRVVRTHEWIDTVVFGDGWQLIKQKIRQIASRDSNLDNY